MAHKRSLRGRVERAMDFPAGSLTKITLLEMESNRRLVIDGCEGILAYTDDCIRLRVPEGELTVMGCGLGMNCLTAEGAAVTGRIQRIEFSGGGV